MKPSCRIVLNLLRERDSVTTHDFLMEGAGSRFGARICELRELGYRIDEKRLPLPARGSRYRLVSEQQTPTIRGDGSDDREGPRDARRAVSAMCEPTPEVDLIRQGANALARESCQHGPIHRPATSEVPPDGSRTSGALFDTSFYRREFA